MIASQSRAQTVHVEEVFAPGHELRVAAMGRDEAIQALSEMTDGDWPHARGAAYREIQIDQRQPRIVFSQPAQSTPSRAPSQHGVGVIGRHLCQRGVIVQRVDIDWPDASARSAPAAAATTTSQASSAAALRWRHGLLSGIHQGLTGLC